MYARIAKVIEYISADNGGCTADEIEFMLDGATDEDMYTIAAGEEQEQQALLARLVRESGVTISVEQVNAFFNAAFD